MRTVLILATCLLPASTLAHKPVTARYNYEEHIRPIFEKHCAASCHRPDGPTPMSLLTYDDARPWAEAIKEEVLLERMPPWPVRSGAPFRDARVLSASEIDRIADWVSGGTPRGKQPAPASRSSVESPGDSSSPATREGTRSASLSVRHELPAARKEEIVTVVFDRDAVGTTSALWLRALDFAPGDRRVVRGARIELIAPPATSDSAPGELLLAWIPGAPGIEYPAGSARRLPAGARLRVRVHYRRPWNLAKEDLTVEGALRLSFFDKKPRAEIRVQKLEVSPGSPRSHRIIDGPARLVAITPVAGEPEPSRGVELVVLRGEAPQLILETRALDPKWSQRLRLAAPLEIENAAEIEAKSDGRVSMWLEYLRPEGESDD